MADTHHEAFLTKLRALRAKADDPSVGEAEAALYSAKVAELLQRYNLTEAALDVAPEQREEVGEDRMFNSKTGDPWAQAMAGAAAELYFCDIYLLRGDRGRVKVVFVGKPHNIEVAMSMTDYLIKTIGRLALDYSKSSAAMREWDYTPSRARYGFERGAGLRMYQRLTALREEQTRAKAERTVVQKSGGAVSVPSNLPALYQDEEVLVKAFLGKVGLKEPKKNAGRSDTSGHHAFHGAKAADNISLNKQVGGGASNSKMIGKS